MKQPCETHQVEINFCTKYKVKMSQFINCNHYKYSTHFLFFYSLREKRDDHNKKAQLLARMGLNINKNYEHK